MRFDSNPYEDFRWTPSPGQKRSNQRYCEVRNLANWRSSSPGGTQKPRQRHPPKSEPRPHPSPHVPKIPNAMLEEVVSSSKEGSQGNTDFTGAPTDHISPISSAWLHRIRPHLGSNFINTPVERLHELLITVAQHVDRLEDVEAWYLRQEPLERIAHTERFMSQFWENVEGLKKEYQDLRNGQTRLKTDLRARLKDLDDARKESKNKQRQTDFRLDTVAIDFEVERVDMQARLEEVETQLQGSCDEQAKREERFRETATEFERKVKAMIDEAMAKVEATRQRMSSHPELYDDHYSLEVHVDQIVKDKCFASVQETWKATCQEMNTLILRSMHDNRIDSKSYVDARLAAFRANLNDIIAASPTGRQTSANTTHLLRIQEDMVEMKENFRGLESKVGELWSTPQAARLIEC